MSREASGDVAEGDDTESDDTEGDDTEPVAPTLTRLGSMCWPEFTSQSYAASASLATTNTQTARLLTRTVIIRNLACRVLLARRSVAEEDRNPRYCGLIRLRQYVRPWMFVSAAWIVPAVLGAVDAAVQPRLWGSRPAPLGAILFVAGDWLIYALLTPGVFAISRRWPLARPHLISRAVLHFFASLLFCVAWAGSGTVLRALLQPQALEGNPWRSFASWLFVTFPFGVAVYLSMVGVEHAVRYFAEVRDREIQMARLSEQLSGARFSALQAQLNPHFLFNTLNTITVLVRDGDRAGATQILEHLSEVLRSTVSRHRTNEVRLQEELELVRQYLAIEQARFSDRLHPEFEIDDSTLSAAVPGFALQHLVENAIRHGIAKRPDAGRVQVVARRNRDMLELLFVDDGPGIGDEAVMPKGHGIENTRERLRSLYGERASLVVTPGAVLGEARGGTTAILSVPYREMVLEADVGPS